jgi:hypothetical protein
MVSQFSDTNDLDRVITDACYLLNATRDQLGIQASAKGLLASSDLLAELDVDYLQIPAKWCSPETFPVS